MVDALVLDIVFGSYEVSLFRCPDLMRLERTDELSPQHRECQNRWTSRRFKDDQQSIQRHLNHLLHFILPVRAAYSDSIEALQTIDFLAYNHAFVGYVLAPSLISGY